MALHPVTGRRARALRHRLLHADLGNDAYRADLTIELRRTPAGIRHSALAVYERTQATASSTANVSPTCSPRRFRESSDLPEACVVIAGAFGRRLCLVTLGE
jgi:hypothetical protein